MGSASVSVVIKSDRLDKKIPKPGEMVRVEGRAGLYEVVRVDRKRRIADVVRSGNSRDAERDLPFKSIVRVDEKTSQTIQQFLKS